MYIRTPGPYTQLLGDFVATDEKLALYKRLLVARRMVFVGAAATVAVFLVVGAIAGDTAAMWVAAVGVVSVAAFGVRMQTLDLCPWCNRTFLHKSDGLASMFKDGLRWINRSNCAYCGMPKTSPNQSVQSDQPPAGR